MQSVEQKCLILCNQLNDMDKNVLKSVMVENRHEVEKQVVIPRNFVFEEFGNYVFVGIRRAGKSFLMYQRMQQLLSQGVDWSEMLYVNFEDERLDGMQTEDLNSILECHFEEFGKRPILFLDEIQIVPGWEKFARRLADQKYRVYITGSNAHMLSAEFMTTLGGRYIPVNIYPYSFVEFLDVNNVPHSENDMLATPARALIKNRFNDYLLFGGFPESALMQTKRDYINSVYQKIYLNDIARRNDITNIAGLRVMLKKMAEGVKHPLSFNRIAAVVSSTGRKLSTNSAAKYVDCAEQAWLITPVSNITAKTAEREGNRKYYFTDNGFMSLFLINQESSLLENLVAIALIRKYGREDEVYFCNTPNHEIDFYVPEAETAIQVAYSIADDNVRQRELSAFKSLPKRLSCSRRIVLTLDEEETVNYEGMKIEIIPTWKWLLQ